MKRKNKQFFLVWVLAFLLVLGFSSYALGGNDPGLDLDGQGAASDDENDEVENFVGVYSIRVLLASGVQNCTVTIKSGDFTLITEEGDEESVEEGDSLTFSYSNGYSVSGDVELSSDDPILLSADDADSLFTYGGKPYRGDFRLVYGNGYGYAVNVVDVEQYLYGVIGQELGYSFDIEALKAQAVASRSYALSNISSSNRYYDVTATTSSQVYGGYNAESSDTRKAVNDTRGMVIMYQGKVVEAFYSSNHGGYSEDIEKVWLSDEVPIKGVPSPYDALAGNYSSYGASTYSWTVTYTPEELVSRANAYGKTDIGSFVDITISQTYQGQTSVSGRAMQVTIEGTKGSVTATKDNIRSLLNINSTLISIENQTSSVGSLYIKGANETVECSDFSQLYAIAKGLAISVIGGSSSDTFTIRTASGTETVSKTGEISGDEIVISGKGYGHGVGMSQWGAIAMADDGYTWEEIIEHYYCSGGLKIQQYYR